MQRKLLLTAAFVLTFAFGFALRSITLGNRPPQQSFKRVTGIGGIFFKSKDPKALRAWYNAHLGLQTNNYGAVFEWRQGADTTRKGFTQWSPFGEKTTYFAPSTKEFMINYRVENLDWLLGELRKEGIAILDTVEAAEYGKFVHIADLEGNKIELWEPNDVAYEKLGKQMGAVTTK